MSNHILTSFFHTLRWGLAGRRPRQRVPQRCLGTEAEKPLWAQEAASPCSAERALKRVPLLEASIGDPPHGVPPEPLGAHFTGTMPVHLLLLLTLLGPGSALQLWEITHRAAPAPLPARVRRQVALEDDYGDQDYVTEGTDPPETLDNDTGAVAAGPKVLTTKGTLEPSASAGPGTPGPATVEASTGHSAGLAAGGTAMEGPSTEVATPWVSVTGPLATELTSAIAASTEGPLPVETTAMEGLSTEPAATEADTTPSVTTEAETTPPGATEAETAPPSATEARSVKPVVTAVVSTEKSKVKSLSRETTATTASRVTFEGAIATTSNLHSREVVFPGGSVDPSSTGASDLIPVKQCLLAILVLALVATVFFVCTVVLAVRLSRKTHTYPVRSYSPTEMVCISALLPEGGEGAPATANGGLPKSQGLKAETREDRDGDDLTLHSFLP
ncbi:P-selectin glycoprotein ligand 1 isoform X2 [Marmota marmota marmota]|uniref:P-selectin glycoprotein ligand 1 isoform X2 n=1 Tax=Marmota marmota marmota TaxID=9994 RepID=UPI0020936E25|nr:P-selectin glycoprotein ligand 1 isoform X2 [Marmota marmota marmota]